MGPLPIDSTAPLLTAALPLERALKADASPPGATPTRHDETADPHKATKEALIEPLQRINEAMRPRGLEFEISEQSSRIITRVIDRETGDVIRQIPAEEVLLMTERLEELQGKLISLKA